MIVKGGGERERERETEVVRVREKGLERERGWEEEGQREKERERDLENESFRVLESKRYTNQPTQKSFLQSSFGSTSTSYYHFLFVQALLLCFSVVVYLRLFLCVALLPGMELTVFSND